MLLVRPYVDSFQKDIAIIFQWRRNHSIGNFLFSETDAPTTNLLPYFRKASKFLANVEAKGGRALVHCVAGCSRSVTIVLMHLMGHHGVYLRDGWEHVLQYRPQSCPNESFKLQLAKLEVEIFGGTSMATIGDYQWNFYEWNRIKSSYPQLTKRRPPSTRGDCCCVQ